jgi:hypothetical protein
VHLTSLRTRGETHPQAFSSTPREYIPKSPVCPIPLRPPTHLIHTPDDILGRYGKTMTWDIKAQLMGKRTLSDLSILQIIHPSPNHSTTCICNIPALLFPRHRDHDRSVPHRVPTKARYEMAICAAPPGRTALDPAPCETRRTNRSRHRFHATEL